jgi:hypothetical protein
MKINMPLYILCTMSQFLNFKSRKFRQKQDLYIILTLKLLLSSIIHTSIQLFQLRFTHSCPRAKRKSRIRARKAAGNR